MTNSSPLKERTTRMLEHQVGGAGILTRKDRDAFGYAGYSDARERLWWRSYREVTRWERAHGRWQHN